MTYYVYVHARPDTTDSSGVFYVGKGKGDRFRPHHKRNRHHENIVNKYGVESILAKTLECSTEAIAHEFERGLIKCLRRSGVRLVNLTDGGEGSSGYVQLPEQRAKISASTKRRWEDPEYKAKLSATHRVVQRDPANFTEKKQVATLRNAAIGREKLQDPEVREAARAKNSELSRQMWADPEFKQHMKAKHAARWTEEMKAAKALDMIGRIIVNNGETERKVKPEQLEEFLAMGWLKGRKPFSRRK